MLGTRLNRSRGNWWQDEGFWTRGKQASCLEIEGPRTSPKTGAPNDREGHQSVTPATDRGPLPSQGQAMTIRRLSSKTQYQYIRHVKKFADFLGRSADKATTEDVHRYQLWLASIGTKVGTANVAATALRFFFKITLKRHDLAEEVVSTREPRRLPVVLSQEEVGRLLASAINIKHKALLSLAYATGLRASEVVSLKLTDIDRDRMIIRVEQGKSLPPRRRGARRIDMSSSRPIFSSYCANGGAPRARRGGCIKASPGCFRATAGSIGVRGSSTGSFAWQRHVPALPNASVFIRCGTVLPRISWSKRPISASSRACPGEGRGSARTQEARHDGAVHLRRHQGDRRGDQSARPPAERGDDARLRRGRCHGQRSRWRTSSATAGRLGVRPMPAT